MTGSSKPKDIHDIDFNEHCYIVKKKGDDFERLWDNDTIINTSCEYTENFDTWYEKTPAENLLSHNVMIMKRLKNM